MRLSEIVVGDQYAAVTRVYPGTSGQELVLSGVADIVTVTARAEDRIHARDQRDDERPYLPQQVLMSAADAVTLQELARTRSRDLDAIVAAATEAFSATISDADVRVSGSLTRWLSKVGAKDVGSLPDTANVDLIIQVPIESADLPTCLGAVPELGGDLASGIAMTLRAAHAAGVSATKLSSMASDIAETITGRSYAVWVRRKNKRTVVQVQATGL